MLIIFVRNGVGGQSSHAAGGGRGGLSGCLSSILVLLVGLGVVAAGVAISLLWVYTEGRMDSKTVARSAMVAQDSLITNLAGLCQSFSQMWSSTFWG